jgi:anti-sigma B factor antagonist
MSLQIAQREREAIAVLDLHGELVLGDDHLAILRHLLLLFDSRRHKVILNLKGVSTVDAAGLATLTFCARLFHDIGGRVVFLNPRRLDHPIADISQPDAVLETYQEEIDAVNSFFPDRVVPRYDILEFVQKRKERACP